MPFFDIPLAENDNFLPTDDLVKVDISMAHFSSHKPLSNRKSAQRCDFLWRLKTVKSTLFRVWYFPTSYFTDSEWESDFVDSWKEHIFPKRNLNSKLPNLYSETRKMLPHSRPQKKKSLRILSKGGS